MSDSLVKIRTEPLHIVQGEMLPVALTPQGVMALLCTGHPVSLLSSWPPSTKVGSGIQLCLHSSLSIAVTPRQASRELQLPAPSFFFSSAHAYTESCQNRCTPESKICNWQGPCGSQIYNNFPVNFFFFTSPSNL